MAELGGKVALVTGAGMGIGAATARALARAGARVVVAEIDAGAGRGVADAIVAEGGEARFVATDVRAFADAERATAAAVEAWGRLDVLVNNAGRGIQGALDAIDEAEWDEVITTNLTSVWRFMRCAVPVMRGQGGGTIVNVSSVQALRGFHGWAAYAAAKGGIEALTRQAAVDLAGDGIRVNSVAPGTIMTPLNEKVFRESDDPDGLIARWNAAHPLGRFGQPEEVAEAIVFLAGGRSSFVTGECLRVDGGLAIKGD